MKAVLVVALAILAWANAQGTLILSSTGRDQSPRHFGPCDLTEKSVQLSTCQVDFEWGNKGLETGIVSTNLNLVTRKPVYANGNKPSPLNTVHNSTTFDTWFNDSPFTKNIMHNLTLTNTASAPSVYAYTDANYFPFDGKGWDVPSGSDRYLALDNLQHNFHFCSEAHGRFAYKGGEQFTFIGDDDVFVFINNILALDLGGVHGASTGSFNLDTIATKFGLVLGNNYRFDFFWCERHTLGSDIKLQTSIEIYCSYYDWCDICDGNGQSCCPTGACNDNNACTADLCAVMAPPTVDCQHIQTNCTASDICHTAACDTTTGNCVNNALVCPDDHNACTTDTCDPSKGGCIHTQKTCDDGNGLCTQKLCDTTTGLCSFPAVNCNDTNACTVDSCDPVKGCTHSTLLCNDNNPCTTDTCDTVKGCVYTPVVCNDNSVCTDDSCNTATGNCQYVSKSCDDKNACTTDSCDAKAGCQYTPVTCNDYNDCTDDTCIAASGCQYSPHSCDDNNACTVDTCLQFGGCQHTAVSCSDGDLCTYDTCDTVKGCSYPAKNCDDKNACTTDSCGISQVQDDPAACNHVTLDCSDSNACTIDTCNNSTGCVHQPLTCPANTTAGACARTSCDTTQGCITTTLPQNECNACFDQTTGRSLHNCTTTDLCHPQVCSVDGTGKAVCIFPFNVTCNDNNACTTDTCVSTTGQCSYQALPCSPKDKCELVSCAPNNGTCVHTAVDCDDHNACTTDSCSLTDGSCSNVLTSTGCKQCGTGSCTTTDLCFPSVCVNNTAGICQTQPVNCDDGNACTDDSCSNGICSHAPHVCVPSVDTCHPVTCNTTNGCITTNITCNDNNNCTVDVCVPGTSGYTCTNDDLCPTTDPCNPNVCQTDDLTCKTVPVNCDDGNACTADMCAVALGVAYCVNTQITCNYTDFCMPQTCNATLGRCVAQPVDCDDGILCTIDSCNSNNGTCNNILNMCDDHDNCTIDQCYNNANSTDGCVHEDVVCQGTLCATASCDRAQGGLCVLTPIYCNNNDTDFCTAKTCDESVGCLNITRTCLLSDLTVNPGNWVDNYPDEWKVNAQQQKYKDNDCFTATCDAMQSKCVVVQRQPFGSDCQFAYYNQAKKAAILTAGAIAGVAIAAVVFAALAGFGAKKGYDAWVRMKDERMGAASTNPMYAPSAGSGTNALYA